MPDFDEGGAVGSGLGADGDAATDAILSRCRDLLAERFGIEHATIQVESVASTEIHPTDCHIAGPVRD